MVNRLWSARSPAPRAQAEACSGRAIDASSWCRLTAWEWARHCWDAKWRSSALAGSVLWLGLVAASAGPLRSALSLRAQAALTACTSAASASGKSAKSSMQRLGWCSAKRTMVWCACCHSLRRLATDSSCGLGSDCRASWAKWSARYCSGEVAISTKCTLWSSSSQKSSSARLLASAQPHTLVSILARNKSLASCSHSRPMVTEPRPWGPPSPSSPGSNWLCSSTWYTRSCQVLKLMCASRSRPRAGAMPAAAKAVCAAEMAVALCPVMQREIIQKGAVGVRCSGRWE